MALLSNNLLISQAIWQYSLFLVTIKVWDVSQAGKE